MEIPYLEQNIRCFARQNQKDFPDIPLLEQYLRALAFRR